LLYTLEVYKLKLFRCNIIHLCITFNCSRNTNCIWICISI